MDTPTKEKDLLKWAGIENLPAFYRDRFYTGGIMHPDFFDALSRFDINLARTMWVYDNVRHGSSVLDLGCGEGVLALLKRKNVKLFGVDISPELLSLARRNGYDGVDTADLTALPFADHSFDYVVSLDVLGHVSFSDKARVLSEIKRVLKPEGVTLHGIECLDRELHGDYDTMSEETLRKFVAIDGHIGLEDDDEHAHRFRAFFKNVETRSRYTLCLSVAEFIKQADEYGVPYERDFIEYLRSLSFEERRAFDMAMGYVFGKISDCDIRLPKSGLYMLLKASDAKLPAFYNAERDRHDLFEKTGALDHSSWTCLDRDPRATFATGWYAANYLPPVARWMGRESHLRIKVSWIAKLRFELTTHIPELTSRPIKLEVSLNNELIGALSLIDYGWLGLEFDLGNTFKDGLAPQKNFELEIRADRTWQPIAHDPTSKDDRELSIAVCNIEIACHPQHQATANVT
jgi:ubiquinone/menaquinone biosynthesis C-methylase UbiE